MPQLLPARSGKLKFSDLDNVNRWKKKEPGRPGSLLSDFCSGFDQSSSFLE
jgi:hypothetical protein